MKAVDCKQQQQRLYQSPLCCQSTSKMMSGVSHEDDYSNVDENENFSVSTLSTTCLTADGSDCSVSSSSLSVSSSPSPLALSEISISAPPKKSKKSKKKKKSRQQKKRRSVQFADTSENLSYDNEHVCKEDLKELWYDNKDYADFRESTTLCAMEVIVAQQLEEEEHASIIQRRQPPRPESALASCSSSSTSYPQTLQRVYQACVQCQEESEASVLTVTEDRRLKKCLAKTTSRWGVERAAVRWIAVDRHYRRSAMIDMVLEMQLTMLYATGMATSDPTTSSSKRMEDRSDLDEVLRLSCEALSRPSRLFARHLAQAAAL